MTDHRLFQLAIVLALLGSLLSLSGTASARAKSVPSVSSCPYLPTTYAGGTDTVGQRYGIQGYIESFSVSVPSRNYYFSDQALHALGSPDGLEVGWYVGYGAQTGTYVTTPHVYVTANGPEEIDGPYIGNDTGFYSVYWQAPPYPTEIFSVSDSGTGIFSGGQAVPNGGPGTIVALGEVNDHSLAMEGYFHGLQHMWSNGVFYDWPGLTPCADSPYTVFSYGPAYVHDNGNL